MNRELANSYLSLLKNDYAGINLTRILDEEEFYQKQVRDSLTIADYEEFTTAIEFSEVIVDVGFGGGFPILPLASLYPDKKFIGLEARNKKVEVVSEIAEKLGITNVSFHHERIENVCLDVKTTVISKAVCRCDLMLSYLKNTKRVDLFMYKGPSFEKDEAPKIKKNKVKIWNSPEFSEMERKIIYVSCPARHIQKNNLVNISDFI